VDGAGPRGLQRPAVRGGRGGVCQGWERNDPDALEAGFYRGLSLLFSGDYAKAEEAFAGVARVLPLAQVVNNEGVAVSRQGHDGIALFSQAELPTPMRRTTTSTWR
jgi:hypothetical protein